MVLRLRKLENEFRLVNVSAEVYEILEMTGFTEMMPVEKARRSISVEGCEAIGRGANGIVYRIDKDTVVKVYQSADCLPDVQRERELARKAFVLGIPTAIPTTWCGWGSATARSLSCSTPAPSPSSSPPIPRGWTPMWSCTWT